MAMTKEQLLAEAKALEPRDRERLAEELLLSLAESEHDALDAAWLAEARRREEAFARGAMSSSAVEDVIARVQSRARR